MQTWARPIFDSASLREFASFDSDVGAHTRRHPILANVPERVAWTEIDEGRKDLERVLGRSVDLFAYPNGVPGRDYTSEPVRMVKGRGVAAAGSERRGVGDVQ